MKNLARATRDFRFTGQKTHLRGRQKGAAAQEMKKQRKRSMKIKTSYSKEQLCFLPRSHLLALPIHQQLWQPVHHRHLHRPKTAETATARPRTLMRLTSTQLG
jgi:hypothetical protein